MSRKPTYEELEEKIRNLETTIQSYESEGPVTRNSPAYDHIHDVLTALLNHTDDWKMGDGVEFARFFVSLCMTGRPHATKSTH
ncbi:MAG: hypothetical protein HY788_01290 [Deltaproteobacteria bacterium]|nr:hypothetical protein [Deltaproteobacteria bacterium]